MCLGPGVPVIVLGAVGGVFALTWLIYGVKYCKEKQKKNDEREQQPILRDQQPNVIHNPFKELNSANRSHPSPIGSSNAKADVNVIESVRS